MQAYRGTLYRVRVHQIRRERRAEDHSSTSQGGSAEPLYARIKGANREVSEGKAIISDHGLFFSYEGQKRGERARLLGHFSGTPRVLEGWMLVRAPTSPTQDLHRTWKSVLKCFLIFLHNNDVWS